MPTTILYPWLRGLIEITGEHDTGKTIAMLQTVKDFKKLAFVDDDVKGDGTVKQLVESGTEFGDYIDLAKERRKLGRATPTADELLEGVVQPMINRLLEKRYDVIVMDTWRIVYQSARGHVERNQHKYSNVVNWRGSSQIIQGLISKVARMIEREAVTKLKDNCDLLLLSHHLKDNYVENINVGLIPESSATFEEICNMRIWLKRNPQSKVPIMLFLKRPNVPRIVPGKGLRPVNVVPLKITPTDKHFGIWDAISEYVEHPIESRMPRPDETPTAEELATISGTLSPGQEQYVRSMIEYQKTLQDDLMSISPSNTVEASKPTSQEGPGSTPADIPEGYPTNGIQLLSRALAEGLSKDDLEKVVGKSFNDINEDYKAEYWDRIVESLKSAKKKKK